MATVEAVAIKRDKAVERLKVAMALIAQQVAVDPIPFPQQRDDAAYTQAETLEVIADWSMALALRLTEQQAAQAVPPTVEVTDQPPPEGTTSDEPLQEPAGDEQPEALAAEWTVAQLRETLAERGIQAPASARKAELLALLNGDGDANPAASG